MSKPASRALVVIDVQNEYISGNLLVEYPDPIQSLANIGTAMDAARTFGIPVVVVQNTAPAGAPLFDKGTHGWELHEVVASRPRDHYVEKSLPSAFAGTDLDAWIVERGIDTVTVVGYMTHNCVAATVVQALHAGLAVEVLLDATGAVPYTNRAGAASAEEIHRSYSVVFQSRFAAVINTAEWIDAIASGKSPERDTIFGSNQRARQAYELANQSGTARAANWTSRVESTRRFDHHVGGTDAGLSNTAGRQH
jgi:nicotinamidase-related amidase